MRRFDSVARAIVAIIVAVLLVGSSPAPAARAASPDPSDVVLVFDFSASILRDATVRSRFATALERIADRVDETSADLVAGDATMSLVRFATRAADVKGCVDLHLLGSPETVAHFADCLRFVADAYRKGVEPALTKSLGTDTNYVAAMEQAAKHLPADAVRPVMILFSDGKHDVKGVPNSKVTAARDRLFGSRSPFALLPVGLGLDPKERPALEAGLNKLRITKDMPACVSGAVFDWPQVGFDSPAEAGSAVAVALQEATCTFTVAPTPAPTPAPTLGAVRTIGLAGSDGRILITWGPPADAPLPIVDYRVRCRAESGGDWITSTEGVSLALNAEIVGVTNGTPYRCEVAAIGETSDGPWTPARAAVTPIGRPAVPSRPAVAALDQAVRISVTPTEDATITGYRYECSSDGGTTWPVRTDAPAGADPSAQLDGLTNGVSYVCRAFAENTIGMSEASPVSDLVKPCSSLLECNGLVAPIVGIFGFVLAMGLLAVAFALIRDRRRGYVLAVLDVVHTANLGNGSKLGIGLVEAPGSRTVTGIVSDRGRKADVRIRRKGRDRFEVEDGTGKHVVASGQSVAVVSGGVRHELVLHAFATNAASQVVTRR